MHLKLFPKVSSIRKIDFLATPSVVDGIGHYDIWVVLKKFAQQIKRAVVIEDLSCETLN